MTPRFELRKVQYMPINMDPGILYVAESFGAAAHLCPCGCGTIVRTPLNRWSLTETDDGPSLHPSIGNWQEPCQSHYWIERGEIKWAEKWSPEQIAAGRHHEEDRRFAYYESKKYQKDILSKFAAWVRNLLK